MSSRFESLAQKLVVSVPVTPAASGTAKVGKVTINGNKAKVEVTVTGPAAKPVTTTMPLVKENGVWKVDLVNGIV